ncbi:UEV-domain-containing protein [Eremomyces bilateralis CBS 781.70]|uniref:UEV-domain-containing protein n=1 Tax=Eremomyces bilateralis CBS 781.70 TaxID=1392243 RepID=A0A6G1GCG2_9PEZI|nr:UEV-domain-containing protein [Eremomyces bilateralis CBS 781.70]KAF1815539.1 UEV-domain-containing protein [Eremomyces bilateralis CBS 781.70]
MSAVPDKVLNWLYSVLLSKYHDANRTYSDVAETLSHYPSLTPRTEIYTFEDGSSSVLLLVSGTLPVLFRGTTYRFPVALWVPYAYPREPPFAYVTPTGDMAVRRGQHVDVDGRIYHPYLAQWAQYWERSSLMDFLGILRGVFAKEPPVISRQQQQYPPVASSNPPPPPVPPPPAELRQSPVTTAGAGPQGSISTPPQPPPKPPKPGETIQEPPPRSSRYGPPPPLPPLPHDARISGAQPQHFNRTNAAPYTAQKSMGGRPVPHPGQPPRPAYGPAPTDLSSPISPLSPGDHYPGRIPPAARQQHPPIAPLPPHGVPQYTTAPQPGMQWAQPPPQIAPQLKPSVDLLSSPLDVTLPSQKGEQPDNTPAPPIPPNPEKDSLLRAISQALVSQINQTIASNASAIPPLQAQQTALLEAQARLQGELDQLQQLDAALSSNEQILRDAMREADRVMEDAKRKPPPEIDHVLVAPTVVGGQLYNLCAEDSALDEARAVLSRALDAGRVSVDLFIKQTRSLAREQFLKKVLIKKIADGMGLENFDR